MNINKTPIVFCFDDNLLMPAGICITSLLDNACSDTFYDIFILHDNAAIFPTSGYLENLKSKYPNHNITYKNVGTAFKDAFQIRGITQATYYRLLIPELIPEYDKIMYHDVDIIFRDDLCEVFEQTNLEGFYIGGVVSPLFLDQDHYKYVQSLNLDINNYILAGNIILNTKLMRQDNIVQQFSEMVKETNFKYQDMDILNIVCKGKLKKMPPKFCGTIELFKLEANDINQTLYTSEELLQLRKSGIIHYNGPKPWISLCPNFDIWWEYYRKSIFYDAKYYFNFYYSTLNALDTLTLKQRVKLLFRYFKTINKISN